MKSEGEGTAAAAAGEVKEQKEGEEYEHSTVGEGYTAWSHWPVRVCEHSW